MPFFITFEIMGDIIINKFIKINVITGKRSYPSTKKHFVATAINF